MRRKQFALFRTLPILFVCLLFWGNELEEETDEVWFLVRDDRLNRGGCLRRSCSKRERFLLRVNGTKLFVFPIFVSFISFKRSSFQVNSFQYGRIGSFHCLRKIQVALFLVCLSTCLSSKRSIRLHYIMLPRRTNEIRGEIHFANFLFP